MNNFAVLFQVGGGFLVNLVPILLMLLVFYFLLIVPQRKRQKELQATIASLKPGDKIINNGGIIGRIIAVSDTSLTIKTADKSIIEIARSSVASKDSDEA
jgi:preprotein translocase subunit YajC